MSKPDPIKAILEIGELLRTQDNFGTSNPMFCVQVRKRVYGMDPQYSGETVWIDTEDGAREIPAPVGDEQENEYEENEFYQETAYYDHWETVAVALTYAGCEEHLRQNGHNYRHHEETRIYVECWHRNPEMVAVREFLMGLPSPVEVNNPDPLNRHNILKQKLLLSAIDLGRPEGEPEPVILTLAARLRGVHEIATNLISLADHLTHWKWEAMKVLNQIDTCRVGDLLKLPIGTDVTPAIMPALERLLPESLSFDQLKVDTAYWAYRDWDDQEPIIFKTGVGNAETLWEIASGDAVTDDPNSQHRNWIYVPIPAPTLRKPKK